MAEIIIEKGGMLTTIQDCGRHGYQRYGMPVSGAMDLQALLTANTLVGNNSGIPSHTGNSSGNPSHTGNIPGAAALEATLVGPEILFRGSCESASSDNFPQTLIDNFHPTTLCTIIAITGADMQPCINGRPIEMYRPVKVNSGDRLTFTGLKNGCRTYIAFAGGLDVPMVMGSRSTYLRAKIGGLEGRPLKAGDVIPLGSFTNLAGNNSSPKITGIIPDYQTKRPIQIIPGPEIQRLDFEGIRTFLTTEYTVSANSDRMGLRLDGQPIHIKGAEGHDIISAGVSFGTIQLPGNGLPIILMSDRQTTGGYARIANILTEELPRVAQLKPGDKINFASV